MAMRMLCDADDRPTRKSKDGWSLVVYYVDFLMIISSEPGHSDPELAVS